MKEWHQSAWQYLNYLQGVKDEHNKRNTTHVDTVELAGDVSTGGARMDDGHGTKFREAMRRSMERPAGEWKPLNRKEEDSWIRWLVWFAGLGALFSGVHCLLNLLDK